MGAANRIRELRDAKVWPDVAPFMQAPGKQKASILDLADFGINKNPLTAAWLHSTLNKSAPP